MIGDEGDGGAACFSNPVAYDLTNMSGDKVAGAGQRRTRHGLLHQGSLITAVDGELFGKELSKALSDHVVAFFPDQSLMVEAEELARDRYGTDVWLTKKAD